MTRGDKHLKKTVYETTCTNCESVLEFEEHEANCSANRNELYFEVKCPVCVTKQHTLMTVKRER